MLYRQYLNHVSADAIDKHIIGRDDRLPRVGHAPGAVHMGVIGQTFGHMGEQVRMAQRGSRIAVGNIVDDVADVLSRLLAPDNVRHQARLACLASMIARNSAMT